MLGFEVAVMDAGYEPRWEQVLYHADGVTAVVSLGTVRVSIWPVSSQQQSQAVVAGLQSIAEMRPDGKNWVIDVSALEVLPLSLVAALAALGERLDGLQGRLEVVGARSGLFVPPTSEEWLSTFHL